MASVGRTQITSLHPLTAKQVDYFKNLGQQAALRRFSDNKVWWLHYFGVAGTDDEPLPSEAYEDPGYDVSNRMLFRKDIEHLQSYLNEARTNRNTWNRLMQAGAFPPNPGKDPYVFPAYFGYWQAENAFRRGFMEQYEERYLDDFKDALKNEFSSAGNILTRSTMEGFASRYEDDPYLARYFSELAEAVEQGKPTPFTSLKALYQDLLKKREYAYRQFSPYFIPLRWAPGAGLVGIDLNKSRG